MTLYFLWAVYPMRELNITSTIYQGMKKKVKDKRKKKAK